MQTALSYFRVAKTFTNSGFFNDNACQFQIKEIKILEQGSFNKSQH